LLLAPFFFFLLLALDVLLVLRITIGHDRLHIAYTGARAHVAGAPPVN
jgi:hypothetical protein